MKAVLLWLPEEGQLGCQGIVLKAPSFTRLAEERYDAH